MGVSVSESDVRVWRDGSQIVPTVLATPVLGSGNVGFRKYDTGGSVWLDDLTVRRYTEPEPIVSVGAPQ